MNTDDHNAKINTYYWRNREAILAKAKLNYDAEKCSKYNHEYYMRTMAKKREYNKQYNKEHYIGYTNKQKQYSQKYYQKHREIILQKQKLRQRQRRKQKLNDAVFNNYDKNNVDNTQIPKNDEILVDEIALIFD
jgi:hypothetical protein